MTGSRVGDVLGGIGLSTCFFLPIAAGSVDARMVLMWTPRHSVELLVAWGLAAAAGAVLLRLARGRAPAAVRHVALALAVVPALISLGNMVARQAAATVAQAIAHRTYWRPALLALLVAALAWFLARRRPFRPAAAIRSVVTAGSLLAVPFWIGVVQLTARQPGAAVPQIASGPACRDIEVLLADELAYDAVFPSDGTAGPPAFAALAAASQVFQHAASPATTTLESVSSYLSNLPAERIHVDGNTPLFVAGDGSLRPIAEALTASTLFAQAHARGYHVDVAGWHYPYCEVLGGLADSCVAYSLYNVSTVEPGFSLLAPVRTIMNLWPYQWPTGLFKRPVAVWFHGQELAALAAAGRAPLGPAPVLRWVHLNVPHHPWLGETGLLRARAFNERLDLYRAQVALTGEVLDGILASLRPADRGREAIVVLISDHGARGALAGAEPRRVPLIIRDRHAAPRVIVDPVEVKDVLARLVETACRRVE